MVVDNKKQFGIKIEAYLKPSWVLASTKSQKTEGQGKFLPGIPGRYDSFYEDVFEEGVEKKYRRVKCLLCGNGKLLSLGNFHRHIKTMHEPPVKCEGCGKEFSGQQIKKHIKVCYK